MKPYILVVDDEPSISTLIQYNLEQEGFRTDIARDGEEALQKISEEPFDLIVLDIMLPKVSGIDVCRAVRSEGILTPILMVTAKSDVQDIIEGLNTGADDYITKPFSPKELVARAHAILRRTSSEQVQDKIEAGPFEVYPERYEAYFHGEQLLLTKKEFELLSYFVKNKGIILSRDQLLTAVWDYDFAGDSRIVDVHVAKLRDKIEEDKKKPRYITTIFGFGYKLNPSPEDE